MFGYGGNTAEMCGTAGNCMKITWNSATFLIFPLVQSGKQQPSTPSLELLAFPPKYKLVSMKLIHNKYLALLGTV